MTEPETDHPSKQLRLQALLALYNEQCAHGRHTELQRHGVSVMLLTVAGVFISVMGTMRFSIDMAPLALCVILVGLFARGFLREFEKKWDRVSVGRDHYRKQVERLAGIDPVREETYQAAQAEERKKRKTLRIYWRTTFGVVALAGLLCLLIILAKARWPGVATSLG
jgi:hypothetical protein